MKISKFVKVDDNILLEYIYDDGNLISEPYVITHNDRTSFSGFVSNPISYQKNDLTYYITNTNNYLTADYTNQLVKLDETNLQYAKWDTNIFSFIQKKDYSASIPVRYDKIKIHLPVNYTFPGNVGFHLNVKALGSDEQTVFELSNYFYDQTNINQSNELQYETNFIFAEKSWGKSITIQFPSPNQIAAQLKNGAVKPNSINYNLTSGMGLSRTAPVFVDFSFLRSSNDANGVTYYEVGTPRSLSFPQTPEFEKFGVVVEPSTQGDFFLIYAVYNGSVGEFNKFIQDSVLRGNRYYVEYTISLYEKNILTKTQKIVVTQDFIDEIEYRPILKYSTTTAIIDVTCKLIDAIDTSEIVRTASYGILQEDVSKFSRYLTKIDLNKILTTQVLQIKSINTPNLDNKNAVSNNSLTIKKAAFTVFSRNFNIVLSDNIVDWKGVTWIPKRQLNINIYPFDNVLCFTIIAQSDLNSFDVANIEQYSNIRLTFKSDVKTLNFDIYQDSDFNELDKGKIAFKISEDKYSDLRKIYEGGFPTFYITGILNSNREIIYSGGYTPWNIKSNKDLMDQLFNDTTQSEKLVVVKTDTTLNDAKVNKSISVIKDGSEIAKSLNLTPMSTSQIQNSVLKLNIPIDEKKTSTLNDILLKWKPYWIGSWDIMQKAFNYQFETNKTNGINKYEFPGDLRKFAIMLKTYGIISSLDIDKNTGQLTPMGQKDIDTILGYLKIHNFNPMDVDIINYLSSQRDIKKWISYGTDKKTLDSKKVLPQSLLSVGSNVPPSKMVNDLIGQYIYLTLLEESKQG